MKTKIKRRCRCGCSGITNKGKIYILGHSSHKHGLKYHPLYKTWNNMKQRCYNKNNSNYKYYDGRKIRVCIRWRLSIKAFIEDMGNKPEGMSIERTDNDGNYTPSNCRWATRLEQGRNTRDNILITHNRKTLTLAEWARKTNINYQTLIRRYNSGFKTKEIFSSINFKTGKRL